MSGRSWSVCECKGNQSDGDKCNHGSRRCRQRARVELRVKAGGGGGWWHYCAGCAAAIKAGPTRELEARPFVEFDEAVAGAE